MDKKKTTKKEVEKKQTPKKKQETAKKETLEKEPIIKEATEKKQEKKYSLIPKDSTDLLLVIAFIALLVLTTVLGFKVKAAKEDLKEHVRANIVVPVLGANTKNTISVDVANMKKGEEKEYIFKISNAKEENVNPEEVKYHLQFVYDKSISLEVTKNDSKENILGEDNLIKDNNLQKEEKQEDIYKVKIKATKNTKKKQLVTINIIS